MAARRWTLIDAASNTRVDELVIRPSDAGGSGNGYCITKRTLRAGLSEGVQSIRVDNGAFCFEVLPTRGMGLWKAWLRGEEIGWRSPVQGPVHPRFVPWFEPGGLGWLEGFDELLVRCGLESNGAPEFDDRGRVKYPLHGRIANRPAHQAEVEIDDTAGEIAVTGEVDEARFLFHRLRLRTTISTRVGEAGCRIRDEIVNLSARPASVQMLYHVNFGLPLLDAGSRVLLPASTVVPRDRRAAEGIAAWDRYAAEEPGYAEQVYFFHLRGLGDGSTQALLRNARGTRGVSLHFNVKQLPCFTLWKNTASAADGYVTGLEPGTNFPNPRSFEESQGRVVRLPPAGTYGMDLRLLAHGSPEAVAAAEEAVRDLQGGAEPQVYPQPQPGWCAM